jgi:Ca2+:H+ antiporter
MTNHHWWQRKRLARKPHSPVTMAAHKKSPYKLFKDIMFSSWANLLLVFIPVGIALHFVPNVNPTVIFVMNFLAIIPLAGVCSL